MISDEQRFQLKSAREQRGRSSGLLTDLPKYSLTFCPAARSNWQPAPRDQSP